MDLRCGSRILHGVLEDGIFEVKCRSKRCGHASGVVVIHRFDSETGKMVETVKFKDPTGRT